MNITGIDVHTYMVKDLSRAITFYRDVLELPLATIGENGAEFELPDGSAFELWNPAEANWPWERGNGSRRASLPRRYDWRPHGQLHVFHGHRRGFRGKPTRDPPAQALTGEVGARP